jgi:hypothetical protein
MMAGERLRKKDGWVQCTFRFNGEKYETKSVAIKK